MSGDAVTVDPRSARWIRQYPGREPHPWDHHAAGHVEIRSGDKSLGVASAFHVGPDGQLEGWQCVDRVVGEADASWLTGLALGWFRRHAHWDTRFWLPPKPEPTPKPGEYSAHDIKVLPGLTAVRRRPGVYVNAPAARAPTGRLGLVHALVREAAAQHRAGQLTTIDLALAGDGFHWCDDGPGLPARELDSGLTILEHCFTRLHNGSIPLPALNALSTELDVENHHRGHRWRQTFSRGLPATLLQDAGPTPETGLRLRTRFDDACLGPEQVTSAELSTALTDIACLNPELTIRIDGQRLPPGEGPLTLLGLLSGGDLQEPILTVEESLGTVTVQVVVTWSGSSEPRHWAWSNDTPVDWLAVHLEKGLGALSTTGRVALATVAFGQSHRTPPTEPEALKTVLQNAIPCWLNHHPPLSKKQDPL